MSQKSECIFFLRSNSCQLKREIKMFKHSHNFPWILHSSFSLFSFALEFKPTNVASSWPARERFLNKFIQIVVLSSNKLNDINNETSKLGKESQKFIYQIHFFKPIKSSHCLLLNICSSHHTTNVAVCWFHFILYVRFDSVWSTSKAKATIENEFEKRNDEKKLN